MSINLVLEYQGYLKFLRRAKHELHRWFGPTCNYDPSRIAFLAAREWDGMADLERKPFIRSHSDVSATSNPYICYLLHDRYNRTDHQADERGKIPQQTFDPRSAKANSEKWKSLSDEQRSKFSSMRIHDQGITHVIEKRDKLHHRYESKRLCILEFILKTKPRWPSSSRMWFHHNECHKVSSKIAQDSWRKLTQDERDVYERCALIDRKRYDYEKNAWITRMLALDLDDDNFTLADFDISDIKSRFDSLGSIVDISKELPSVVNLRRPRNPFSLFIEAYRYQIRDERPEFQFGKHLRECSQAWSKLSDEERNFYIEESKKLKEKRKHLLANEPKADSRLTVPIDLFKLSRSVHGPCRPSHLYPKLPTAMALWAQEHNIPLGKRSMTWKELPESVRSLYEERRERLRHTISNQKTEIDRRHKLVKQLIREAVKLEDLKQELHLIGSTKKAIKNLYA